MPSSQFCTFGKYIQGISQHIVDLRTAHHPVLHDCLQILSGHLLGILRYNMFLTFVLHFLLWRSNFEIDSLGASQLYKVCFVFFSSSIFNVPFLGVDQVMSLRYLMICFSLSKWKWFRLLLSVAKQRNWQAC